MRLWHYALLPYLPELQFKGQLREMVTIMHDLRDKGATNHLLINVITCFSKRNFAEYFRLYHREYTRRYSKQISEKTLKEFNEFFDDVRETVYPPFEGWHCKEYLRVCMANLYEKHTFGQGSSRITDKEWQRLLDGYKKITGEDYKI